MEDITKNNPVKAPARAKILSILFLFILLYPGIDQTLNITKRKKTDQVKKVVLFPSFDTTKTDSLPKKIEEYYTDKFSMQDFLVEVNSYFKIKFLGVSPDPAKVTVGKNGWLFWGRYTDNYRGINLFTDAELKKLKKIMDSRGKWYREKNIRFYFSIPPDKPSVYPEYMPAWIHKVTQLTLYDQVVELFKGDTLVPVIDLRKPIMDKKTKDILLYNRIDHHWTEVGAFYAYLAIIERIRKDFPEIVPLKYEDFTLDKSERLLAGGESEALNFSKWYKDEYRYKLIKNTPFKAHNGVKSDWPCPDWFPYCWDYEVVKVLDSCKLPSAFIIRDSFGDVLIPFFQENFRKSQFFYDCWGYKANKDIISKEKPDIVILMPYESNLKRILECSDD